jgi:hypothetical protein
VPRQEIEKLLRKGIERERRMGLHGGNWRPGGRASSNPTGLSLRMSIAERRAGGVLRGDGIETAAPGSEWDDAGHHHPRIGSNASSVLATRHPAGFRRGLVGELAHAGSGGMFPLRIFSGSARRRAS